MVPPGFGGDYSDFQFIDVSIPDYFRKRRRLSESEKKLMREENSRAILDEIENMAGDYRSSMRELFRAKDMAGYINSFQLYFVLATMTIAAIALLKRKILSC